MHDLQFANVLRYVGSTPWAITPEIMAVIRDVIAMRAAGVRLSADEIRALIGAPKAAARSPFATTKTGLAVIGLRGLISHRADNFDDVSGPQGTSVERFTARFREALANDAIGSIVIDVDSPGGAAGGIEELAAEIFEARDVKPIVAVANTLAASAAYWIASAAGEIAVTPSGEVGSIGVFSVHEDLSQQLENQGIKTTLISAGKFKVDGNPFEPLSPEARVERQGRVDSMYGLFVDAVARGRAVSQGEVRNGFGEGHVVNARQAVGLGMVDRIATLDQTIARLGGQAPAPVPAPAARSSQSQRRHRFSF